jgi:dipeptidyl aminopeptidase/acylaminoacyl peptidase
MLHGPAGKDLPCQQSVEMATEMKRLGIPHQLITVKNGGHSLWGSAPKQIGQAFDRSLDDMRGHLLAR